MSGWMIYLITRLDSVQSLCLMAVAILIPTCIGFIWVWFDLEEEWLTKWAMRCAIGVVFSLAILTLLPSSKEAVAIYLIPKIVNNEKVANVPDRMMDLLNLKLDEWMKDVQGKESK